MGIPLAIGRAPAWASDGGSAALYAGDMLRVLADMPESSVDCVWTDPPYKLSNGGITCVAGRMVSVDKGAWDKSAGLELDHQFNLDWIAACRRALKPTGTIWVSGTLHLYPSVGMALLQNGFRLLNDIVWEKPNPPPNLGRRNFTHSTEVVLWASKARKGDREKHTFNYDAMRRENGDKQMKTVWRIAAPGRDEKRFGKHPTQKPVALIARCIRASTHPGGVVLDPFAGSGSAGVAALREGRRFIGVEADERFIETARLRLEDAALSYPPPPPPRSFPSRRGATLIPADGRLAVDKGVALEKLQALVGRDLRQIADEHRVTVWDNGKMNKGWAGHAVERYLGLPLNSSQNPNLGSWELKVAPLALSANGAFVVKETMAITMLDPQEVLAKPFAQSHLFTKLRKIIAVARTREDAAESRSVCKSVHAFDLEETALYDQVAEDYETIRRVIETQGFDALTGSIGALVQPRTKGAGHGSKSRAFYARKEFVEYIAGLKDSPRSASRFAASDCPMHAGHENAAARRPMDDRMARLARNQSGAGRHKCPYCAYEQGYQQALDDIIASAASRRS